MTPCDGPADAPGRAGAAPAHGDAGTAPPVPWHAIDVDETYRRLESAAAGLDAGEAEDRLARHGPNRLPEATSAGPLRRFLSQFDDLLIYVLLAAAAVTAVLGHFVDTSVILAVTVVNATIGFIQEGRAEAALAAIRGMLAPQATVLRDGRRVRLPGDRIVPGDVLLLEAGDRVAADVRLTETRALKIDEALLTGESLAAEKDIPAVAEDAPLGDRTSMAFSGSLVAAGQGRGVVVGTGAGTEIGRISGLLAAAESVETPLTRQMARFAKWLTFVIVGVSILLLAFGAAFTDETFTELFMTVVGLAVAAIPEGLPAILTVTLAIGVQGMARRNAIVRKLPAIEALGSVSVICSDKTGTLTRNEMSVEAVVVGTCRYRVSGVGYDPTVGAIFADDTDEDTPATGPLLDELALVAALCNDAELKAAESGWEVAGDPMEGALAALAGKLGVDVDASRAAQPRLEVVPFDAAHRFMATSHPEPDGRVRTCVKGAPEAMFALCDSELGNDGAARPLDPERWREASETLARGGQRVLALAVRWGGQDDPPISVEGVGSGLALVGLVGITDPPREEAIAAVAECRAAGIRVKMITGDHAGTASAIAAQLGLAAPETVLEGRDLDALSDVELIERAAAVDVFARTSPEHKLRLVEALQAGGAVVAMTGDGVNDAPALKRADIGIAMGGKGTDVAKEAAEIVLADDNFATIAAAVKAGRTVYDNLKKAIVFLLPVNGGESLSLIAALLLGLTLPITPLQILWVNMVSSVVLAMTLAFEPSEPGVMARPPRRAKEPLLSGFVLWRVAFVSALFCGGIFAKFAYSQFRGVDLEYARTVAVNTLVVMEIFYLFSVRYLDNPSLTLRGVVGTRPVLIAVAAVTALQCLFTYAPFMERFFHTRPLDATTCAQVFLVGVLVLIVLEVEKRVRRNLMQRRGGQAPTPVGHEGR